MNSENEDNAQSQPDVEASHHFMHYATVRPPWLSKEKERAVRKRA